MSLTLYSGPFGRTPAGQFNFSYEPPGGRVLYFEATPRRVRTLFNGETVADSSRARLLHESGLLPMYYLPAADVRSDLLVPSERHERSAHKGNVRFWSVRVGERIAEDAAWAYEAPKSAAFLNGHIGFRFDAMDSWYEEDDELIVHPPDPYHRIDIRNSSRHVRVMLDGLLLAESRRPKLLFETSLPVRYYLPTEDVRMELLEASDSVTGCAYKGWASYWSARVNGEVAKDIAWTYNEPRKEGAEIKGLICFFNERVDLLVDGLAPDRPETAWSQRAVGRVPLPG